MPRLGELESTVMGEPWQTNRPMPVREVFEHLRPGRQLSYTTVMTVLNNLRRKQWVQRRRSGRAYIDGAALGAEQAAAAFCPDRHRSQARCAAGCS